MPRTDHLVDQLKAALEAGTAKPAPIRELAAPKPSRAPIGADLENLCKVVAILSRRRPERVSIQDVQRIGCVGYAKAARFISLMADYGLAEAAPAAANPNPRFLVTWKNLEAAITRLREAAALEVPASDH